ncbi:uncharacterized protein LOC118199638 [Stegodyphus dumicola]|uniref:uncharacterized protein LOC118199638 n=1 Tax=Stegodyphus dumicola TaxID=202533 RepID=UPI0015B2E317|nr:uncharacterized protein LOC118199638 [Stegodyphus dumicola]
MRALKLNDIELFESGLSPERVHFFTCHVDAFKRMWTEEGLTYWLRFLMTFKSTLENNVVKRPECCIVPFRIGAVLLNFVYISIHQKFIEGKCNSANQLIKHIFTLARFFSNLADSNSVHRNPFNTKDSREAFRNLLGKPDFLEDYPMSMVAFACTAYFEFAGAICSLLKRWISEPDLTEAELKKVDISNYYWMPFEEWEEKSYSASCFEKYVSDYWGDDLPRMLLTTNVNNTFNSHIEKGNCCSLYKKNVNIFDIFKTQCQFFHAEKKCIIPVKIIVPSVVQCDEHTDNCYIKIKHDSSCSEPFICNGKKPCVLVCESYKAEKLKNHEIKNMGWKTFHADTFTCKQKNKRNVCTLAENFDRSIETYLLKENEEHFQSSVDPKKLSLYAKLFIEKELGCCTLPFLDPECLNYFEQVQRKIDYKKKLQKKLAKKHLQINNKYETECTADSTELLDICKKAQELLLLDLVIDKYYSVLDSSKCFNEGQEENDTLCTVTDAMNTIALGTHDVVYGRVVLPLKKFHSQKCQTEYSELSQEICNGKMHHSRESSKRSKSAKKLKSGNKVINGENLQSKEGNIVASNICEQEKNIHMVSETELKNDFQKDKSSEELESENKVTADIGLEIKEKSFCDSKCKANTHVDSCTELLISSEKAITSVDNNVDEKSDSFKSECDSQLLMSGSSSIDMVEDVSRHNESTVVELNGEICDSENIVQSFNKSHHSESVQLNSYSSCDEILFENPESDHSRNADVSSQDEKLVDKFFALILNGNRTSSPICDPVSEVVKDKAVSDCSGDKRIKFKTCAYCGEKEVKCKTFKRCSRCKVENFKQQRYYCSRDCQVSDWEESHRDEHSKQT